jgi:hypothetical protein
MIEKIFKRILRLFGIIGPSDLLNKEQEMKTVNHNNFISINKYSFSDTHNVWSYYICFIYNRDNEDCYNMVFSADNLTEYEALKQCINRLDYKNKCNLKIRTNNIHKFIKQYKDEIDKFNKNYDVEIREV